MNRLIVRLLRQHVSIAQLTGFFLANLFGMVIILLGIQFYKDVLPLFTGGDSFMKGEYVIVSKKISTLGSFTGKSNTFSTADIEEIKEQSFTKDVGGFTPTLFNVSAGINMAEAGVQLSTAMFFESVPDEFVDINLDKWSFNPESRVIPIVVPRNYLNLYNFGFAQSRNLPKISEGLMGMVQMNVVLRGNGQREEFKGNIVGFSNRLNTILVPQSFMNWANNTFSPGTQAQPSRLIIEVNNPADPNIAQFFRDRGYEAEDNKLDAGKTTYFLRLVVGIVLGVGVVITILSFYMLMLSIFLLLQKNTTKLESLLLIGYSPKQVSLPYQVLTSVLSGFVLIIAVVLVYFVRNYYLTAMESLFSAAETGGIWLTILIGVVISCIVAVINILVIRKKINGIWRGQA